MLCRFLPIVLLLLVVGCGPAVRSYSVTVKNDAAEPMTVWLTKDGGPVERAWASPEQIAAFGKPGDVPLTGVVIEPGETLAVGPLEGRFDQGVDAVLRIYRGEQSLNDLLAMNIGSPNRTDIPLAPGSNTVIIDKSGAAVRR